MFTGLVEEIGKVLEVKKGTYSASLTIEAIEVTKGLKIGDSICTNGVCLTVTHYEKNFFTVDVMPETMRKSNLGELNQGSLVNLEHALSLGDPLGGHMVSGHIDGVGIIKDKRREGTSIWVTIQLDPPLTRYMINHGSIAIDGASLTLARVQLGVISVSLIPLTQKMTTLMTKKIGETVNIECDMALKFVEKLNKTDCIKGDITLAFLKEHGFA